MADEPIQTSAPVATADPPSAPSAPPRTEPTPSQAESKAFDDAISREIDDLFAKVEGKAPKQDEPKAPEPAPEPEQPSDTPKPAEAAKSKDEPPTADPAEMRRQAYEQAKADFEAQERAREEADRRVRAEAEHRREADAYVGADTEYQAVVSAIEDAMTGDTSALNALDVVLPNGKRVSEVKGSKGLTEDEAVNLKRAWDTARKYEDVIGDRKVQRLVELWNADIVSGRVLDHPDVDAAAVTKHSQPHDQMAALRDSVIERVTTRLTAQHTEVVKAKDDEIKAKDERIASLLAERGNLASNRAAADAATVDRPGQPGALRRELPTPEEVRRMSPDEFFKSGHHERILQSIPGGQSRRAG